LLNLTNSFANYLTDQKHKIFLPWQVDIDTTNICNQDCYYCNTAVYRSEKPIYQNEDNYHDLLDKLYFWKSDNNNILGQVNNVIFSGGGEPTLLPGFEEILEKSIDYNFVTAINTNGTKLSKLLKIDANKLKKMAYIGLDIDSADPITYEKIRRSLNKKINVFNSVKKQAKELGKQNVPLDVKALIMEENSTDLEMHKLFEFTKEINARSIHFRPVVLNGMAYNVNGVVESIKNYSKQFNIPYTLNLARYQIKLYKKCHQILLFPTFGADGNIYVCCEYKGNPEMCLGSWIENDWRELWGSARHIEIYNSIDVTKCKPCRPNHFNNVVQQELDDPDSSKFFI